MKTRFKRLRGMPDLLPQSLMAWHRLEAAVRQAMHAYGYGEIRTPLLERTSLFTRSIGESTDIVEKEMYSFTDPHGEMLSLRPENTAACARAAIENGLLQPGSVHRLWYTGPMFRYERPQLGRQRQFFQCGTEVYGLAGPAIEAELILLSARLWREMGIIDALRLEINTLGDVKDRARYREQLVCHFEAHRDQLDEDSLRRLTRNPLRILDSKNPAMQTVIAEAPRLRDCLSESSLAHFDGLQELLQTSGIELVVNPRLVRGLDYYSHTVFEWTTDRLGAQSAVCAGGRYDGLLSELGAGETPGVGWAFGMERVVALMQALGVEPSPDVPDVFVIGSDEVTIADSMALAEYLRQQLPQCAVVHNTAAGSLKSQFRKADKSGAALAVVIGGKELAEDKVALKPLRGGAAQRLVPREAIAAEVQALLGGR